MRKLLALLMAVLMLTTSAMAETIIDPLADRQIEPIVTGDNEVENGVSPTTGRKLGSLVAPDGFAGLAVTGRYLPMLVQIGNDGGGVGERAPWGISYADVIYEMPLTRNESTRMTAVFSDLIPDSVGYVRSARVGHVWLREEWDGGFLFYGQQEASGSNVKAEFRALGATDKGVLFSGTSGGTAWKQYYTARKRLKSPYNMDANVAAMSELVPDTHTAPNHAFRFTDEKPEGDKATYVYINWGESASNYGSRLVYRKDWQGYIRNVGKDKSVWYADRDSLEGAIAFANVIVQFTTVEYNHNNKLEPVVYVIGEDGAPAEGNADFFMCGKHISGYWKRDSMTSRTVYYGPDGNEIELQRGRTLIIVFPNDGTSGKAVSYE
ncbi:MAG: DUF3048 domain-containing protein [Clostridia bacterium]|nr:DUF3048 domain-containing protein [Clostridia bacterium]